MNSIKKLLENEIDIIDRLLEKLAQIEEKPKGNLYVRKGLHGTSYFLRYYVPEGRNRRRAIYNKLTIDEAVDFKTRVMTYYVRNRLKHNRRVLERLIGRLQPWDVEEIENSLPATYGDIPVRGLATADGTAEVAEIDGAPNLTVGQSSNVAMVTEGARQWAGDLSGNLSKSQLSRWAAEPYSRLDSPSASAHYNICGRALRSKSEVIIANALDLLGIPFRVDAQLSLLDQSRTRVARFPDFTIKTPTGHTFFWEHFGKLSDENYVQNMVGKIILYALNDIVPGRDLIISADNGNGEIDSRAISNLINAFVMPEFKS